MLHVRPLSEVVSLAVEDLDARVRAVRDEDAPVRRDTDIVRQTELAWPASLLAPRVKARAVLCEAVDAVLPVAVRDIEIAPRRAVRTGRLVEGHPRRALLPQRAKGLQQCAVCCEDPD